MQNEVQSFTYAVEATVPLWGGSRSEASQNNLIIHQNLFWAESLFFAIHVIADTVVYHGAEAHAEESMSAVGNLANIGKVFIKGSYLLIDTFEESIRSEHDLEFEEVDNGIHT